MIGKTNAVIVSGGGGEDRLKKLLDTTKSAQYLFYNYKDTSVDDLIQPSDTENVTNMNNMFSICPNLTSIPQLDTSNVTNMNSMFNFCNKLSTIPQLNTGNVTNMYGMFNSCGALTTIPLLDTGNVTDMRSMVSYCRNLTTVPALDASKVTNMDNMFSGCSNLKSILMTNIGVKLDISASTKFEREDLLVILNNLKTVTSATTLTMGATNLAKLTDEDKAIATNKGWTLA